MKKKKASRTVIIYEVMKRGLEVESEDVDRCLSSANYNLCHPVKLMLPLWTSVFLSATVEKQGSDICWKG